MQDCIEENSARPWQSIECGIGLLAGQNGTYGIPRLAVPWIVGIVSLARAQQIKEGLMFVRKVTTLLKPNSISKFSLLMEEEVIPILRKQNGFQDELTFFAPNDDAVTGISLWDKASNAEVYSRETYPAVLNRLATVIEGTPKIDTYEVVNCTFHKSAAAAAA